MLIHTVFAEVIAAGLRSALDCVCTVANLIAAWLQVHEGLFTVEVWPIDDYCLLHLSQEGYVLTGLSGCSLQPL